MVLQEQDGRIRVGFAAETMETKEQIETFARIAVSISTDDVEALVEAYNRLDTIGPLFDPTAYWDVLATKDGHIALAKAFLGFRRAIDRIVSGEGTSGR